MAAPKWNVMQSLYAPIPGVGGRQQRMPSMRSGTSSRTSGKTTEKDDLKMFPRAKEQYLNTMTMLNMEQRAIKTKMNQYLYDSDSPESAVDDPEFKELTQEYYKKEFEKNSVKAQQSYSTALLEKGMDLMANEKYASLIYMDESGNTMGYDKEGSVTTNQNEIVKPITNRAAIDLFGRGITNLGEGMPFGADYDPDAWEKNIVTLFNTAGTTEGLDPEFDQALSADYRRLVPNAKDFLITATRNWDQLNAFGKQVLNSMSFEDLRSARGAYLNAMLNTDKEITSIDEATGTLAAEKYTKKDFKDKTIDKTTGKPIKESQIGESKKEPWRMEDFGEWFAKNLQYLKEGESTISISKMATPAKTGKGLEEDEVNYWTMVGTRDIFNQPGTRNIYTTGNASKTGGIAPIQYSTVIDPMIHDEKMKLQIGDKYAFADITNKRLNEWSKWWHETGKNMSPNPITISGTRFLSPRNYVEEMMAEAIDGDAVLQSKGRFINTDYILDAKENPNPPNDNDAIWRQIQTSTTFAHIWNWMGHSDTDEYYKTSPWIGTSLDGLDVIIPGQGFVNPEQIRYPSGGYILGIKGFFQGPNKDLQPKAEDFQLYTVVWTMMSEDEMEATKLKVKKGGAVSESNYLEQKDNPDLGIHSMDDAEDILVQDMKTRIPGIFTDLKKDEPFYDVKENLHNYYLVPMIIPGTHFYTQAATTPRPKEQTPPIRK